MTEKIMHKEEMRTEHSVQLYLYHLRNTFRTVSIFHRENTVENRRGLSVILLLRVGLLAN